MKYRPCIAALALAGSAFAANAQAPATPVLNGPASEAQVYYARLKANLLKSADTMPESGYQFRPTPEIRTYARVINHVTETQFHFCTVLIGAAFDQKMVPGDTVSKAEIVAGLKASFAMCDQAYGALTDANVADRIPMAGQQRSRIGLLWSNLAHDNEQYAELATYLRLKGLVPPTAEK